MSTLKVNYNGNEVEIGVIIGENARGYSSDFVQRLYVDTDEQRYKEVLGDDRAFMFNGTSIDEMGYEVQELSMKLNHVGMILDIVMYDEDENGDELVYSVTLVETDDMDLAELEKLFNVGDVNGVLNWTKKYNVSKIEEGLC